VQHLSCPSNSPCSRAFCAVKIMKQLQHVNIVRFIDIHVRAAQPLEGRKCRADVCYLAFCCELNQTTERHIYLIMEYCGGGDLSQYIKLHGPLDPVRARHLLRQLCMCTVAACSTRERAH
jgi:serine/threonine protein kinase